MSTATKVWTIRLFNFAVFVLLASLMGSGPVLAQGDPGPNVNIIGLTLDPNDIPDKFYRQQNEPSCAVRPGDSACIICAYNDYRTLDVPAVGDAWQGVSQSCDAGNSWLSRAAPGSPADLVAPLPAEFAADPRLQAIPGMAILNFIAGYRASNEGVLAIQHWLEVNKEDADHYEPGKVTYIADSGTSGRFIDKPDMVAVLDPPSGASQSTISLTTDMENESLGSITRDFPSGTLYVAYAVFTGSNSVKVLVKNSFDWGRTFKNQALKLSEDQNQVSGITLTAIGDKVLAVWRRVGDNNNSDAIMYSVISNGGKKATKGAVLAEVCAFDQPTIGAADNPDFPLIAFRTNDFPWSANDGDNFYAFYSDRRAADGSCSATNGQLRPRIVAHYSGNGGVRWSDPITVSPEGHTDSFQFMPTAFGANGKIQIAWYDTRREAAELESLFINKDIPYVADHVDIDLTSAAYVQRKVDVYTTSFTAAQLAVEDSSPNDDDGIPDAVRVSQYSITVGDDGDAFESEASFANKKLFGQGKLSFLGDYIALAARQFRKNDGGIWESNADLAGGDEDFFAAWTDNRDVRGEVLAIEADLGYQQGTAAPFAKANKDTSAEGSTTDSLLADSSPEPELGPPRDITKTAEGIDGSEIPGSCDAGSLEPTLDRARDANIYGSLIKDRVRLYAPTPSKPLGGLQRAFVVSLANAEDEPRTYDLKIADNSCNDTNTCRASFRQMPSTPDGSSYYLGQIVNNVPVDEFNNDRIERITIPANSTLARTVFVVGAVAQPVVVQAFETQTADDGTVTPTLNVVTTVALGNDNDILDPDVCTDTSCNVQNAELHNLTLGNLTLGNLDLANQELLNLTLGNLTLGNLTLGNLTLGNLTLGNLTLGNLTLGNLTLGNLTLGNATLANQSLIDQAILDPGSGLTSDSSYRELLEWAIDPANGVDPALLNPALLGLTIDDPDELLNLTLGNLTLGNLTLGNLTLGNLTLGNLTLGNASEPNLTLGNLTLGNLTLGNAAIADPVLNEATCPAGEDCEVSGLSYEDYTYPITNKGNVTTAIDADITVEGDVAATQLIAWTANITPASVDCENILQMQERVQAVVNNPDESLSVATIGLPFNGEISTVAGPGETVFFTLRVFGTQEQLRNVSVSGFTASSQAANCRRTIDPVTGVEEINCSDKLNDGVEQIVADKGPPVITMNPDSNGDVSPMFVDVDEPYIDPGATAFDAVDGTVNYSTTVYNIDGVEVPGVVTSVLETYEVIYSAQDAAGNSATASRWVTIVDNVPPTISQSDIMVTATDPDGIVVSYTPITDDNFNASAVTVSCTISSGSLFDIGPTHPVTCTATDAAGLTADATFNVAVKDGVAPTITQDDFAVTATDPLGISVSYSPTTSDNYSAVAVTCIPPSGTVFDIGPTHPVTCTATDADLNTASVTFNVAVTDGVAPTLILPADITAEATSTAGANVPYSIIATDNTGVDPTVTCTPASGSLFAIEDTPVTCTATDGVGNSASGSFTVTVQDNTSPVINVADGTEFSFTANDPLGALVNLSGIVTATDLGEPIPISCVTSTGIVLLPLPEGSSGVWLLPDVYNVNCTASDGSTTSIDVQVDIVVDVVDDVPPVITVNGNSPDTVDEDSGIYADLNNASASDNVDTSVTVTVSNWDGDTSEPGVYTIYYDAVDSALNPAAQQSRIVTVLFAYDINLIPPKGRARAGSTVPLDWQYLERPGGAPVDSSGIPVAVTWEHMADDKCLTDPDPLPSDGSSTVIDTDSGNSDFRYSYSNDTWQFSWQSPDTAFGPHKVSISPPGASVEDAWECIILR